MRKGKRHILLFLLVVAAGVQAQTVKDVVLDTVPVIMQPQDPETASRFDSIGPQHSVVARSIPQRIIDSLKAADDFWYAQWQPQKRKVEAVEEQRPRKTMFQEKWFRGLLWVIILSSFIGVVIWYLVASNIFIFRKRAKKVIQEEDAVEATDDIFALPYDQKISKAAEAGNYRLAVRLWYLRTLKELSDRELIDYRVGRTNQDYVRQMSKSSFYHDFFRLTRNFEYTWYGQFDLSAAAYEKMKSDFIDLQNRLR